MRPLTTAGSRFRRVSELAAAVRLRLRESPNGEHEMALNRLAAGLLLVSYFTFADPSGEVFLLAATYGAGGVLFFGHLLARPRKAAMRQKLARFFDLGLLSYSMHVGGQTTAVLYPLYLWIVFGNGFRFGIPALRVSAAIAVVGFALAVAFTPYWRENYSLSLGLLLALLVLPAYASTLIRKLSQAKVAAEEASRAKSLFLASMSHELRTPLNSVIGMTELLESTDLDDDQRDMARTARNSGRELLAQIDELLNFSRIEAGRMPVRHVDFDLHAVLAEARGLLTAQARAKGLRLGVHVTPRTPYWLKGEARQIKDILVNLVGNAVKFTETGGVVVAVDAVVATEQRLRLRFEVSDTGIGIAEAARKRIFETFAQADETVINTHGGTGLGLAICKQLVELNGGEIDVESEVGFGSTFWFELDLERGAPLAGLDERPRSPVIAMAVSDARAQALAAAVAAAGWPSEPAVGLREALRLLRARSVEERGPAAIVVDAEGSEVDGQALIEALRAAQSDNGAIALIDPDLGAGLPSLEIRMACASASGASLDPDQLRAMLRVATASAPVVPAARPAPAAIAGLRRLSILVAEDNRTNQKVIRKVLERAGHEVRIADNGELALDALTERSFDLVLMDVNMPVLDGLECTKLYRFASLGKPRIPIVALTADATSDARVRCLDAGMDACLTKPIEPAYLLATIDELAGGGRGAATEAAEGQSETPAAAAEVDDEIVANIANHPRYRATRGAVVDRSALDELEELGGREFVADLIDEFIGDAAAVLSGLRDAVAQRRAGDFREHAHALRSGAANIGARGMYELCLSYRNLDAQTLAATGAEHVQRLEAEFERVRKTLQHERASRTGDTPR
ncbi:response regulator [Methylopila henanensis]|uniref:histidine kinase n=1 Tax=Methylopila henanensis TaxID=873516 RepID=A0ABW4K998_9HYPH